MYDTRSDGSIFKYYNFGKVLLHEGKLVYKKFLLHEKLQEEAWIEIKCGEGMNGSLIHPLLCRIFISDPQCRSKGDLA